MGENAWNFDISAAPLGYNETRLRTTTVKGEEREQEYQVFVEAPIWVALSDGKVFRTRWLPPTGDLRPVGRWWGLDKKDVIVAWQHYVIPAHPGLAHEVAA